MTSETSQVLVGFDKTCRRCTEAGIHYHSYPANYWHECDGDLIVAATIPTDTIDDIVACFKAGDWWDVLPDELQDPEGLRL